MERIIMIFSDATCKVWTPRILGILRIIIGFLFLQHGTAKLFGIPHVAMFDGLQLVSVLGLAGILELVGGLLILVGLFTRPTAFILSGEMAFAYFMAHAPHGLLPILNQGELAVLYCFVFLYLAVAGAGDYSIDATRSKA
jgi:putative oxidoreductase